MTLIMTLIMICHAEDLRPVACHSGQAQHLSIERRLTNAPERVSLYPMCTRNLAAHRAIPILFTSFQFSDRIFDGSLKTINLVASFGNLAYVSQTVSLVVSSSVPRKSGD